MSEACLLLAHAGGVGGALWATPVISSFTRSAKSDSARPSNPFGVYVGLERPHSGGHAPDSASNNLVAGDRIKGGNFL